MANEIIRGIEYAFLGFTIAYALAVAALILGRIKKPKRLDSFSDPFPFTSIVVAARNESQRIRECVASLLSQEGIPCEVIVVDDRSADDTPAILAELSTENKNLKTVRVEANTSGLTGKQNALHEGIMHAGGEIILSTDADSRADKHWAQNMVKRMCAQKAGFVFGITEITPVVGFLQRFQGVELRLLFGIAVSLARLGLPGSCMGNNIGFRKDAYLKTGGYPDMGPHPTEDLALMHRFLKNGHAVAVESGLPMQTAPLESWGAWVHQHMRWLKGGFSPTIWMFWPAILVFAMNVGIPAFLALRPEATPLLLMTGLRVILDMLFFTTSLPVGKWPWIPILWPYYVLGTPVFSLLLLLPFKTRWKGDALA